MHNIQSVSDIVLVYGLGRSGRAVIKHLAYLGWSGVFYDENPTTDDVIFANSLGFNQLKKIDKTLYRSVIAAPGVRIDHPDLLLLQEAGNEIIGELELGYRTLKIPTIGITGTAGKTTTTALIAYLLRGQGINARECGNFDPAFLEIAQEIELAVVEISSFQLERIDTYRPDVAVITNLGIDHLDRHKTVENYHATKLKLVQNLRSDDCLIKSKDIFIETKARVFDNKHSDYLFDLDDKPFLPITKLSIHPQNASCALKAVLAYLQKINKKPNISKIKSDLLNFVGVKGRFEIIGSIGNVKFIDDSIATRTIAVKSALENAPSPIVWIIGGLDKGAELSDLAEIAKEKVSLIIAIGKDGPYLASNFDIPCKIIDETSGFLAIEKACEVGLDYISTGSILLAPIGASFDQFSNYQERSKAFRDAFKALKG